MTSSLFLYSGLVFLAALIGGSLPLFIRHKNEEMLKLFVSLGAGLLLGMALIHLLPEAHALIPKSFSKWFLAGFVLLLLLERFVMIHACEEDHCDYHTIGTTAFVGLAIHGFIEGMALGSSLLVAHLAPLILIAILAHKGPSTFTLTVLLRLAKRSKATLLFFIIGTALSGPAGIFTAYFLLKGRYHYELAGILLALSAGTFLYIAACDLIPELHRTNTHKYPRLVAFLVGIAFSFISIY